MNFKKVFILLLVLPGWLAQAQNDSVPAIESNPDNYFCFSCHGNRWYTYYNADSSQTVLFRMFKDLIIDSADYYRNNHKTFACTDCHNSDYNTLPHPSDLKLEIIPSCMDCHDDSEFKPGLNFKTISDEYDKSVHAIRETSKTNCWSCHNPHSYRITARGEHNISEVVAYDNSICLECHSGMGKFDLLYGDPKSTLLAKHEWLPDPVSHFKSVRCIECHTKIREDLLVAHNIRPKEEAVRICVECHSSDSRLKQTLYKYELQQEREKEGIFPALVSSRNYAIGTNPNPVLNLISLILLGMAVAGIGIHAIIRILKK
jgi:hypothetical protein